jgi:hypothetical protein
MSYLRELLANDINNGDMTQSDSEETSVDRIGALARADPLGAALWRVVGNLDVGSFVTARGLLLHRLARTKMGSSIREELLLGICQRSMEEWLACQCQSCGGRRTTLDRESGVRVPCMTCEGTGRRKVSHDERMRVLRIGSMAYAQLIPFFDLALETLEAADAVVAPQIARQLERGKRMKAK